MFFRHNWPALLWTLIVFILCVIPGQDLPRVEIINFDKIVHACIFGLLTILFIKGFSRQTTFASLHRQPVLFTLLFCIPYGGLLEIIQETFCINRTGDWFDFLWDTIGCLAAAWITTKLNRGKP